MARGYPDFSPGVARDIDGRFLQTIAEAPVWFYDDFETPVKLWYQSGGTSYLVTTGAIGAFSSYVYSGAGSLYIITPVFGPSQTGILLSTPPSINRIGIMMNFKYVDADHYFNSPGAMRLIELNYFTGTKLKVAIISYNPNTGNWYLSVDNGATMTLIVTKAVNDVSWHFIKLVVDLDNNRYRTLRINNIEYDISAYAVHNVANLGDNAFDLNILLGSSVANQAELWVDNYKVTYGEI